MRDTHFHTSKTAKKASLLTHCKNLPVHVCFLYSDSQTCKGGKSKSYISETTGSGLTANGLVLDCQVQGIKIAF